MGARNTVTKTLFVKDLAQGTEVEAVFVAAEKTLATKKDGAPFLQLAFKDATGSVKAVAWDNVEALSSRFTAGDYVKVWARVSGYRGETQLVVGDLEKVDPAGVDPGDFIPATTKNRDQMLERLKKILGTVTDPDIKALVDLFFEDDEFVRELSTAPAAKKMHHAYVGGLLEHTLSVTLLADLTAAHYQGMDRDLLVAGAFFHDIGKIKELSMASGIDYSDPGRLLSHLILGVAMVDEKLRLLPGFPEPKALLLKHLIVSHHGSREFGSPEPPKTLEAVALNILDDLDAKIMGIRTFMEKHDDGGAWTPFHRIHERHFFLGRPEEE